MYKRSGFCAAAAAVILGLASLTGCSSGGSSSSGRLYDAGPRTANVSKDTSFFDYTVTLNGEDIVFPVSRNEMLGKGWIPDNEDAASGYYEKDGVRMLFRMCEKLDDDFAVNGMSLTNRNNSDTQFTLKTPAGVELNVSTKEDVEAIYGEADKIWENGEYFYYESGSDKADDLNMDRNCFGFGFDDSGVVRTIWVTH